MAHLKTTEPQSHCTSTECDERSWSVSATLPPPVHVPATEDDDCALHLLCIVMQVNVELYFYASSVSGLVSPTGNCTDGLWWCPTEVRSLRGTHSILLPCQARFTFQNILTLPFPIPKGGRWWLKLPSSWTIM